MVPDSNYHAQVQSLKPQTYEALPASGLIPSSAAGIIAFMAAALADLNLTRPLKYVQSSCQQESSKLWPVYAAQIRGLQLLRGKPWIRQFQEIKDPHLDFT